MCINPSLLIFIDVIIDKICLHNSQNMITFAAERFGGYGVSCHNLFQNPNNNCFNNEHRHCR